MGLIQSIIQSFRGPRCPLDSFEKEWIEGTFLWLKGEFGTEPLCRPPLLPTIEHFSDNWFSSHEDGITLAMKLCQFMYVDPSSVDFAFFSGNKDQLTVSLPEYSISRQGPVGLYVHPQNSDKFLILLDEEGLERPTTLVATICHELGHIKLLGEGRLSNGDKDHERKTDLLTIYFGVGIFTANSAIEFEQWTDIGNFSQGWQMSRLGYLSEPELGYSLAAYALLRSEPKPAWKKHLNSNIRYYFNESSFFLQRSGLTCLE